MKHHFMPKITFVVLDAAAVSASSVMKHWLQFKEPPFGAAPDDWILPATSTIRPKGFAVNQKAGLLSVSPMAAGRPLGHVPDSHPE